MPDAVHAAPEPQITPWGVDLEAMQKNIIPGDNFYLFANGAWENSAQIAPEAWSAGAVRQALDRTDAVTKQLIAALLSQTWPEDSDEAKFVSIYKAYADRKRVNRLGRQPVQVFLQAVGEAKTHDQIAEALGSYQLGAQGLFHVAVRIDPEGEKSYLPSLEAADLLLGSAHNYMREEASIAALRQEGTLLLEQLLRASGQRLAIGVRVQRVLQLETQIAALYASPEMLRANAAETVFMSLADLQRAAPAFPWASYFAARGVGQPGRVQVSVSKNLEAIANLFAATPVRVWQDYMRLLIMSADGAYLSDRIAKPAQALEALRRGTVYVAPDISERAGQLAMALMPDVIGRAYLNQSDQAAQIAAVATLAEAIRQAYRARILAAQWPSPATKMRAVEKLDALQFIIGEPPGWNDYADYKPSAKTLFENVYLARQQRELSALSRLRVRPDAPREDLTTLRRNIFFSPLQVGAYYLPRLNTVIIPANYLQAPFYDRYADMAVNFGALGTTIGHELGHAFDDQGSKYGPEGQLEDWWTPEDRARFEALSGQLADQFATYEAVPGINVKPGLTLGENLSDLVGLEVAYDAYLAVQANQEGNALPAKEGARRFLLGYAQKRQSLRRPGTALDLALTGPHSPPVHRVNGIVRNLDFWYDAFDVGPEQALWLAPEKRVKIW